MRIKSRQCARQIPMHQENNMRLYATSRKMNMVCYCLSVLCSNLILEMYIQLRQVCCTQGPLDGQVIHINIFLIVALFHSVVHSTDLGAQLRASHSSFWWKWAPQNNPQTVSTGTLDTFQTLKMKNIQEDKKMSFQQVLLTTHCMLHTHTYTYIHTHLHLS